MAVEGIFRGSKEKFRTPEEELAYLRERLNAVENKLESPPVQQVQQVIREYAAEKPERVLHKDVVMKDSHVDAVVLDLAPEEHDKKMAELLGILQEKGIRNTLSVVAKLSDPHIEDDFHRFLVEYLKEGHDVRGLKEKGPVWKDLTKTLFEITVPGVSKDDEEKELKQLVSSMQQFYAGMMSVTDDHLTFEIATAVDTEDAIFYIAVPNQHISLFEKHLLSIFPQARVHGQKNDYNVFNTKGVSVGSYATLRRPATLPLKIYEDFDYDPLNVLLSAFSKLQRHGEGAAIQIVFKPVGDTYTKRFKQALDKLRKGEKTSESLKVPETIGGEIVRGVKDVFFTASKSKEKKEQEKKKGKTVALKSKTAKKDKGDEEVKKKETIEAVEIFEAHDLIKIAKKLDKFGLTVENFVGGDEEAFEIKAGKKKESTKNLSQALLVIKEAGKEGVLLQRYKGLGEMNPDQLWNTTMDPAKRTILKVTQDD